MAGMFCAIHLDILKHSRDVFRATVTAILFALGILRGGAYAARRRIHPRRADGLRGSAADDGTGIFAGNRIRTNLNDIAFKRLIAVILIISGLPLLIR